MSSAGRSQQEIAETAGPSRAVVGRLLSDELPSLTARVGAATDTEEELPFYEPGAGA